MHVVVNITSDSEFPSVAPLDIVWKRRLVRGERFTSLDTKRPETPGKRKIKRTEIPLLEFLQVKGIKIPHPFWAPTQHWKRVEKKETGKMCHHNVDSCVPTGRTAAFLWALLLFAHTSPPCAGCFQTGIAVMTGNDVLALPSASWESINQNWASALYYLLS